MTLHELLEKPVWQMTGEELLFLAQQKAMQPEGAAPETSSAKERGSSTRDVFRQRRKTLRLWTIWACPTFWV